MTVNRAKKNIKQRGSKTHGWGSMKKHRGAGSRGGRGNAGSGKRGDVKKPSFRHEGKNGRHGFSSPLINPNVPTINLSLISQKLDSYIKLGFAKKSKDGVELDLTKLKLEKLLASGNVTEKLIIRINQASSKAIEKVEAAGGKIIILSALKNEGSKDAKSSKEVKKPSKEAKPFKEVKKPSKEAKPFKEVKKPSKEAV